MQKILKYTLVIIASTLLPLSALAQVDYSSSSTQPAPLVGSVNPPHRPMTFTGKVTSVSDNSIIFTGKKGISYTADATNAKIVKRNGALIAPSDIKTDDMVSVHGQINGTIITATLVSVRPKGTKEINKFVSRKFEIKTQKMRRPKVMKHSVKKMRKSKGKKVSQ